MKGSMGQDGANDSKTRCEQLGGTTVGGAGGLKGDTVGKDEELDGLGKGGGRGRLGVGDIS